MGLWDRQDIGTTAKGGSHRDVPGAPNGTVGQTGHRDRQDMGQLPRVGVLGTPGGTVGQTRRLGQLPREGVLGTPSGTVGQTGRTGRTLGQLQRCGSPWDVLGSPVAWDCGTYRTLGQLPKHRSP